MKKLLICLALILVTLTGCGSVFRPHAEASEPIEETVVSTPATPSVPIPDPSLSSEELIALMTALDGRMDAAHRMAEAARELGYPEEHDVIQLAKSEYMAAYEQKAIYQEWLAELARRQDHMAAYPTAAYIWYYFKDLGYNDYVVAGLLGNMMVEAGGSTLNIQPTIYSPGGTYYGICQWHRTYYGQIHGASLESQCNFLASTIASEMNIFGGNYYRGFNYDSFCGMADAYEAARAFGLCYERGAGINQRGQCALTAYNYFTA